jgi:hypothetical protein
MKRPGHDQAAFQPNKPNELNEPYRPFRSHPESGKEILSILLILSEPFVFLLWAVGF